MDSEKVSQTIYCPGSSRITLTPELKASLQTSLASLKLEKKFDKVNVWGCIRGNKSKYYIAQGFYKEQEEDKVTLYSKDCTDWHVLPAYTEEEAKLAKLLTERFAGDSTVQFENIEIKEIKGQDSVTKEETISIRRELTTKLFKTDLHQLIEEPRTFKSNFNVNEFLKSMEKYFNSFNLNEEQKLKVTRLYLDKNAQIKYDNCTGEDYKTKLRKAFIIEPDLTADFQCLLDYRRTNESSNVYIEKVEALVRKFMKHNLSVSKLTTFFLKHCLGDDEVKQEIEKFELSEENIKNKMKQDVSRKKGSKRGPTPTMYIRRILKEADEKKIETRIINKSYAEVVKKTPEKLEENNPNLLNSNENNFPRHVGYSQMVKQNENCNNKPSVKANEVNVNKVVDRFTQNLRPNQVWVRKCFRCHEEGHIRRECPTKKCFYCKQNGHFIKTCFLLNQKGSENYPRTGPAKQTHRNVGLQKNSCDPRENEWKNYSNI